MLYINGGAYLHNLTQSEVILPDDIYITGNQDAYRSFGKFRYKQFSPFRYW